MNIKNITAKHKTQLLRRICGSLLIAIPAIPFSVSALPSSVLNPCPRIYYETPHNSRVLVPEGCPPNDATLRQRGQGGVSIEPEIPVNRQVIPAPENLQKPIVILTPTAGKVDVRLKNNTNARISYQVITHTEPRILAGGSEVLLRDVPTPFTITAVREDGGWLKFMPISTSDSGTLAVSMDEETNANDKQGVLRIQRDGQVLVN